MNNLEELDYYALSQLPPENFENQPYYSYPYLNIREAFGRQFSKFWSIYRVNQIIYNAKKLKEWKDTVLAVDSAIGNSNVQLEGAEAILTDLSSFFAHERQTYSRTLTRADAPLNGNITNDVYENYVLRNKSKIEQLVNNTQRLTLKRFVFSAKGGTGGMDALHTAVMFCQRYKDKTSNWPLDGQIRVITFDTELSCDYLYLASCQNYIGQKNVIQFKRPTKKRQAEPLFGRQIQLSLYKLAKENSVILAFAAISLFLTALVSYLFILLFLVFCSMAYRRIMNETPRKETFVQSVSVSSIGMFSSSENSTSHTNRDRDSIHGEPINKL